MAIDFCRTGGCYDVHGFRTGHVSHKIVFRILKLCKDVKTADKMLVGTEWDEALAYARGEDFE